MGVEPGGGEGHMPSQTFCSSANFDVDSGKTARSFPEWLKFGQRGGGGGKRSHEIFGWVK